MTFPVRSASDNLDSNGTAGALEATSPAAERLALHPDDLAAELDALAPLQRDLRQEIHWLEKENPFAGEEDSDSGRLAEAKRELESLERRERELAAALERRAGAGVESLPRAARRFLAEHVAISVAAGVTVAVVGVFWFLSQPVSVTEEERSQVRRALGIEVMKRMGGERMMELHEFQEQLARELHPMPEDAPSPVGSGAEQTPAPAASPAPEPESGPAAEPAAGSISSSP